MLIRHLRVPRDWCPKFATGLNIKNVIVQKVYEWSGWYFTKMMPPRGDHYDKRTTLSMLYFLNYAYFYIWSSRKFCLSVSKMTSSKKNMLILFSFCKNSCQWVHLFTLWWILPIWNSILPSLKVGTKCAVLMGVTKILCKIQWPCGAKWPIKLM